MLLRLLSSPIAEHVNINETIRYDYFQKHGAGGLLDVLQLSDGFLQMLQLGQECFCPWTVLP